VYVLAVNQCLHFDIHKTGGGLGGGLKYCSLEGSFVRSVGRRMEMRREEICRKALNRVQGVGG
jgi:hypothetical protein